MAIVNGPKVRSVGSSSYPLTAIGAHNFKRDYYKHAGSSGDVRGEYQDLTFTSTGSGETLRVRAIADADSVATGGTMNAIHATARIKDGATISGAANAIRATIESAHDTPGGTIAAIQLDSNIVTSATLPATASFIHVSNTGSTDVTNLFYFDDVDTAGNTKLVVANHDTSAPASFNYAIKINIAGTTAWIPVTTDTPAD